MNLTTCTQHKISINVEDFDGGITFIEFLETLHEFRVVLHVHWRYGGLQQRQRLNYIIFLKVLLW